MTDLLSQETRKQLEALVHSDLNLAKVEVSEIYKIARDAGEDTDAAQDYFFGYHQMYRNQHAKSSVLFVNETAFLRSDVKFAGFRVNDEVIPHSCYICGVFQRGGMSVLSVIPEFRNETEKQRFHTVLKNALYAVGEINAPTKAAELMSKGFAPLDEYEITAG
jgi:hypothetical protein